jgi:hydrogenase/urease accessory protein HupE
MKRIFLALIFLFSTVLSPPVYSHAGFHGDSLINSLYHPVSGIDHFLVILIIGFLSIIFGMCIYKK